MKNTTILMGVFAIVVVAGIFMFTSSGRADVATTGPQALRGEVQQVTLGMKDFGYYPKEVKVKEGQPVEVTLDKSVVGCGRSFAIRELGVSQYAQTPSQKITFTPSKKGTFLATCSMGMVKPIKFIVE